MMTAAVNKNYNDDAIIRISPGRNTLTVETKGADGSITYKEISPVEFYYTINQSYLPTISMSSVRGPFGSVRTRPSMPSMAWRQSNSSRGGSPVRKSNTVFTKSS